MPNDRITRRRINNAVRNAMRKARKAEQQRVESLVNAMNEAVSGGVFACRTTSDEPVKLTH